MRRTACRVRRVREALRQLASTSLIDIKPRRGTAIAGMTRDVKVVEERYKAARAVVVSVRHDHMGNDHVAVILRMFSASFAPVLV